MKDINLPIFDPTALLVTKVGEKDDNGRYTWETKVDAVTKYLATNSLRAVQDTTGVNINTFKQWQEARWYPDLVEEIRKTQRVELNTKLSKIVDKALAAVEDRIEDGEIILNSKTGALVRKPVSLRDASRVASDLMAQQNKLEEQSRGDTVQSESVQDVLKQLANEFAKFNRRLQNGPAETIEYKEL